MRERPSLEVRCTNAASAGDLQGRRKVRLQGRKDDCMDVGGRIASATDRDGGSYSNAGAVAGSSDRVAGCARAALTTNESRFTAEGGGYDAKV